MTDLERKVSIYFNERYDDNLQHRFMKLNSEYSELLEAFGAYYKNVPLTTENYNEHQRTKEHLIDELGDVVVILSHISSIIGTDFDNLLINALVKSKVRETNKNYLK